MPAADPEIALPAACLLATTQGAETGLEAAVNTVAEQQEEASDAPEAAAIKKGKKAKKRTSMKTLD